MCHFVPNEMNSGKKPQAYALPNTGMEDYIEQLRRMLPPGVPLPENLDFSIAPEYDGPPIEHPLPVAEFVPHLPRRPPSSSSPFVSEDLGQSSGQQHDSSCSSPECNSRNLPTSSEYPTTSGEHGPVSGQQREKGKCCRCLKGIRMKEKETCLVCYAKYCSNCVLQVMGSMPEGRKCETCIGQPVHESRRTCLGKPSRLLKRILSPLEVQQVMKSEKECPANQLHPEQIYVNGEKLTSHELAELLGCPNPPRKVKPGKYWYDKVSGLWGKEGEKPSEIIACRLRVGGQLKSNASKGATEVYINNREISKAELYVLKYSGVQCPPKTYLTLYSDGRYEEEGFDNSNNKGNLWKMASVKFLSTLLSLPVPRGGNLHSKSDMEAASKLPEYFEQRNTHKILLLGNEGSGRSTIFKQAKILYKEKLTFTREELLTYREMIRNNIYKYLGILLEARECFEEEEESKECSNSWSTDEAKDRYKLSEPLREAANLVMEKANTPFEQLDRPVIVEQLWQDPAVQATYQRAQHMLPGNAVKYFSRVTELFSDEYIPSDHDVLCAEGLPEGSGLAEEVFSLEDKDGPIGETEPSQSTYASYHLISIGGLGLFEFRKLDMFRDIEVLVYCLSISDYDQMCIDRNGVPQNKMIYSKELFRNIVTCHSFSHTPLVLLFNKYDEFKEKISSGNSITVCEWFSDFSPVGSSHANNPQRVQSVQAEKLIENQIQQAYIYIVHKFKRLLDGRRLYTLPVNGLDKESVECVFAYIQQVLICEEERRASGYSIPEDSICSDSSSSRSFKSPCV